MLRGALWLGLFAVSATRFTPLAYAQDASGAVVGRVTDSTDAAVPGAILTLTSKAQGNVLKATANAQGEFTFNGVTVGAYTLEVAAKTFGTYVVDDVLVNANNSATINAKLHPGSENSVVTVEADSLTLDTHSATLGQVIDQNLVENLPLDGNNVVEVAAMLPGVTDVNAPTTFTSDVGGPTYNISGSRANQNLFLLDGALWNNLYNNTGLNFPPRQGMAQVSIQSNGFKAQYGRNIGSVLNVVSKTGGNAYHGQVWDFIQNKALNATDYISQLNPKLVQNQLGGTIGGPIIRDKLFFFLTFQDLRSVAAVVAEAPTPTLLERGLLPDGTPYPCQTPGYAGMQCAEFAQDIPAGSPFYNPVKAGETTYAVSALNAAYAVSQGMAYSPTMANSPCVNLYSTQVSQQTKTTTGTTSTGATQYFEVPKICWNPVAVQLMNRLPLPNVSTAAGVALAVSSANQPRSDYNGMARLDLNLPRNTISLSYYQTHETDGTANGVTLGTGIANYEINTNSAAIHYGQANDIFIINGNAINTFRIAYKRYDNVILPSDQNSLNDLGAVGTYPYTVGALPQFSIDARLTAGSQQNYSTSVNEDVELNDAVTYVRGKHNYQVGVQFLRLQYKKYSDTTPSIAFGATYTDSAVADFLQGFVAEIHIGNGTNYAAIQHDLYSYIQDDWRISSHLTLNYGLRYEIPFQWYQPDGQAAIFRPGYQSTVFPTAPPGVAFVGDRGVERSLVGTDYNNFAPRFGFAYDVGGKGRLTVRGGIGLFYDSINALVVGVSTPFHYATSPTYPVGGLSSPLYGLPNVPSNYVKGQTPAFNLPYSINFPDNNFRTPYTTSMNLGFQLHMGHGAVFETNYVGHLSHRLALSIDLNPAIVDCHGAYFQINPSLYCPLNGGTTSTHNYAARARYQNFNVGSYGVVDYMTEGWANYHALQTSLNLRESKHLTTIISYTYSKSLDVSSNGISVRNVLDRPNLADNYGPSDFDTRHIFNIGFTYKFPKITRGNFLLRAMGNNWGVNGIYNARTGHPLTIFGADRTLRDETPERTSLRNGVYTPLPSNRHRVDKVAEWFNTNSFCNFTVSSPGGGVCPATRPGDGYGTESRNMISGPAYILTSGSLNRSFAIPKREGARFTFRVDAFNLFNTPNLGNPNTQLAQTASLGSSFGIITATTGGNGAVATNGRRFQLSGTFFF